MEYQASILADYSPYPHQTDRMCQDLAAIRPARFAIQHGSSFAREGSVRFATWRKYSGKSLAIDRSREKAIASDPWFPAPLT